jgi:hypothetical protein
MGPPNESGLSWGSEQNFAERENCGTLNGVKCSRNDGTAGELVNCEKKSVEVGRIREQVRGPAVVVVKDEG